MPKTRVSVSNHQSLFAVDTDRVVAAVNGVLDANGIVSGEVGVAIVDDPQIHVLNRKHLDHDYPTDVLSFLYEATGATIDGELVVSTETARRVGQQHGMQEHDELLLYVVHGTLHLVGFDDDTDDAQAEMRSQERRHLLGLGIELPDESTLKPARPSVSIGKPVAKGAPPAGQSSVASDTLPSDSETRHVPGKETP